MQSAGRRNCPNAWMERRRCPKSAVLVFPGTTGVCLCLVRFLRLPDGSRCICKWIVSRCFWMASGFQLPFFWKEFGLSPFSVQISKITRPYIESCQEREGELRKKLAEEQVRIQDDPRLSKLSQLNIRCVYIQWYTYIYIYIYYYIRIYIYAILSYNSTKESESDSLQECTSRALWPPGPPLASQERARMAQKSYEAMEKSDTIHGYSGINI